MYVHFVCHQKVVNTSKTSVALLHHPFHPSPMSAPDIIVGDFYPHIRDAILSHLFNCDLYSLRATCTALRDAVDPLTLDTLVITGHPYHPKMQVCCLHGRSPALSPFFDPYFKNASDATLQRYRMLFSRVREVEIRSKCVPEIAKTLFSLLTNVHTVRLGNPRPFDSAYHHTTLGFDDLFMFQFPLSYPTECPVPARSIVLFMTEEEESPRDYWPSFSPPVADEIGKVVLHVRLSVRTRHAVSSTYQEYVHLPKLERVVLVFYSSLYHHFRHWYFVDDDPDPFAPGTTLGVVLGTIPHNIRRVQYTLVNVESLKLFRAGEGVPAEDIVPAFKHAINSEIRLVHPSMSEKEVDEMMDKIEFMTKEDYIAREGSDQL